MFVVSNINGETLLTTPDFLAAVEAMDATRDNKEIGKRAHIDVIMDYHSAIGFLKALRGYSWFVRTTTFAPTIADPERGFSLYGNVSTTRKEVLRVLDNMYGTRFKNECSVRFTIHGTTVCAG
jgi:hypothetical protein